MALIKIVWGNQPREVPGLGFIVANQETSVKEKLAKQFIRQGFARAKKKPRRKRK